MATQLTTEEVKDRVSKLMPAAVQTRSALTLAGATNIDYDTDILSRVALGGPGLYKEGERKAISETGVVDTEVFKAKLVYILLYSTEADRSTNGSTYRANQMAQVAAGLTRGADVAVLNGTNPATGVARADLAAVNIKDNAGQAASSTGFMTDVIDMLKATPKSTGLILSSAGFSEVAYAQNPQGGMVFPTATKAGAFTFLGGDPAVYSDALGINGWNSEQEFKNTSLAAAGPWSSISRSFSEVTVERSTDATVGTVNLFLDNFIAYKIEQFISFVVPTPDDFSILKSA